MNSKDRTILTALYSIPLTEPEQSRIVKFLSDNEGVRRGIRKVMPRSKAYKAAKSGLKIPGFRPDKPTSDEPATIQLLSDLTSNNVAAKKMAWRLYRDSIFLYLAVDQPNLLRLIETVEADPVDDPAVHFKSVFSNASEFEVSEEGIRKFYNLCWVPRIQAFDSLVGMITNPDPQVLQARKVEKLEEKLIGIEKRIDEVKTEINTSLEDVKSDLVSELSDGIEKISEALNKATPDLKPQLEASIAPLKVVLDRLEKSHVKLGKDIEEIQSEASERPTGDDLREELDRLLERLKDEDDLANTVTKAANESEAARKSVDSIRLEVEKRGNLILTELKRLESEIINSLKAAVTPAYQSPLKNKRNVPPSQFRLKSEPELIASWSARLSQTTPHPPVNEELLATHSLLLSSSVTVAKDVTAIQEWIASMGWSGFVMDVVVSPNWLNEKDWAEAAYHIFPNTSVPRILILHDYDSAIPECYLLPSLALWKLQEKTDGLGKIFLIPLSGSAHPSAEVLEHATYFPPRGQLAMGSYGLRTAINWPRLSGIPPVGVDPRTADEWRKAASPVIFDFAPINRTLETEVPRSIVNRFHNTVALLSRHFIEKDAISLALSHDVLPWVRARFTDARCADLVGYLEQLL